ncbi:hypothetical protein BpHYR1_018002 [Brachionus plicatilis]|uniref:Uncharacterized protein n=1 Tax=Brachionus plicatilis TaxID=10195 RepID=A0A3M7QQ11_BRAPC|nr:hypothetical protein BpHYR1_018002 [Brachionus plicatilis]
MDFYYDPKLSMIEQIHRQRFINKQTKFNESLSSRKFTFNQPLISYNYMEPNLDQREYFYKRNARNWYGHGQRSIIPKNSYSNNIIVTNYKQKKIPLSEYFLPLDFDECVQTIRKASIARSFT